MILPKNVQIDPAHWQAIWLTLKLAGITTLILLLLATPLSWWLATTASKSKPFVTALVSLPLVLPPTVLGFYLLVLSGPRGFLGKIFAHWNLAPLPFTFEGIVFGSVIFSMPFAVQPIRNAFESIGRRPLEVAATLRASRFDTFFSICLPMAKPGFLTAMILVFSHTLGEFGVVLMLGGNIPGETQVLSVAIYNYVEAVEYQIAHLLSAGLLLVSFLLLLAINAFGSTGGAGPNLRLNLTRKNNNEIDR